MDKSLILTQLKVALKLAMMEEVRMRKEGITSGDEWDKAICHKTVSRAIISMFPEIGVKPADATDDDVIKLLKKYISQEKERTIYELGYLKEKDIEGKSGPEVKKLVAATMEKYSDEISKGSMVVRVALEYLPAQATEEEIVTWINDNIDFFNPAA